MDEIKVLNPLSFPNTEANTLKTAKHTRAIAWSNAEAGYWDGLFAADVAVWTAVNSALANAWSGAKQDEATAKQPVSRHSHAPAELASVERMIRWAGDRSGQSFAPPRQTRRGRDESGGSRQ